MPLKTKCTSDRLALLHTVQADGDKAIWAALGKQLESQVFGKRCVCSELGVKPCNRQWCRRPAWEVATVLLYTKHRGPGHWHMGNRQGPVGFPLGCSAVPPLLLTPKETQVSNNTATRFRSNRNNPSSRVALQT